MISFKRLMIVLFAVLFAGLPAFSETWSIFSGELWDLPYPETFGKNFPVLDIPDTDGEYRAIDPRLLEGRRNLFMFSDALAFLDEPSGIESPHTAWGRPLVGGPVSVLYVAEPTWRNREIIELGQRLDCDIRTLFVPGAEFWRRYPNASDVIRERQVKTLEEDYDVIVLNHGRDLFNVMDENLQSLIKEKVKEGTGLVVLYERESLPEGMEALNVLNIGPRRRRDGVRESLVSDHFVSAGIDMEQVYSPGRYGEPRLANDAMALITSENGGITYAAAGEFGNGRIVGIADLLGVRHVGMPQQHGNYYRYWEQVFSLQARAVLWAAGRAREGLIAVSAVDSEKGIEVKINVEGPGGLPRNARAEVVLYDDEHQKQAVGTVPVRGEGEYALTFEDRGRYGLKIIEVRIVTPGGEVLDWASASCLVPEPADVEFSVASEVSDAGRAVTAEFKGWRNIGASWRLRITDSYGRLVGDKTSSEDKLVYNIRDPRGVLFDVKADILDERGAPVLRRRGYFTVPRFGTDDYHNYFWGISVPPFFQKAVNEICRDMGVDGVYLPPWQGTEFSWYAAASTGGVQLWGGNLASVARGPVEEDRLVYPPLSPQWYDEFLDARNFPEAKEMVKKFGAGHISMQDEGHQRRETSFDEWTIGQFREFLREKYGDLNTLNSRWETDFGSWDEVRPKRTGEMEGRDNYAPWLEFRRFMDSQMAEALGELADEFREVTGEPDLPVGVEGIWGFTPHHVPYGLYDYQMMSEAGLNAISPYIHEFAQIPSGSSYAFDLIKGLGQDYMAAGWVNAYNEPWMHVMMPWWGLFHGGHATSYYTARSYMSTMGAVLPRAELVEGATRPLREGAGKLVIDAERHVDPVGIYFNMGNFHLAWIIDRTSEERVWFQRLIADGKASLERIFQDIGITPGWITDTSIKEGDLENYRMIILTGALMLSDETLSALEDYVENGGIVIADGLAGMYDETGRPADPGRLEDLFGVTRKDMDISFQPPQYSLGLTDIAKSDIFPFLEREWMKAPVVETGLRAEGSIPLGRHVEMAEAPAFFVREKGEGRTMYINALNATYVGDADERDIAFWRGLFASCGIEPAVRVESAGEPLNNYDIKTFKGGGTLLAGIIRSPRFGAVNPVNIDVRFPVEGVIYDVIRKEIAGRGVKAGTRLKAGQPALLASVPVEVNSLRITSPRRVLRGEAAEITLRVLPEMDADTVIRVVVSCPAGEIERALSGNFSARGGEARVRIPFAYNAERGNWTVEASDVISGVKNEAVIQVR